MGALFGKIGHAIGKGIGWCAGVLGLGTPEITVVVPSTAPPVAAAAAKDYTPYILLGIGAFVVVMMMKK